MPLPVENVAWPPEEWKFEQTEIREHSAWYSGDPLRLAEFYGDSPKSNTGDTRRRWQFWSRRADQGESSGRTRLHIPLAGDIAAVSADMLFSEAPTFLLPEAAEGETGSSATQARLVEIVDEGGVHNTLIEAAEISAALGGVYLRPVWDLDLKDHPFLTVIHPDQAVPVFRWGELVEVTFWQQVSPDGDQEVYRHLELHERDGDSAVIKHGLFRGTSDKIGLQVALESHPATADLIPEGDTTQWMQDGLTLTIRLPELKGIDVEYVPNIKPNRKRRGSPMGRSDFQSIEGVFDALDETWTSWQRDIRLGQGRLIVPMEYLERSDRGRGAAFDVDKEIFVGLEMDPSHTEGAGITIQQFEIRTEEHQASVLSLIERAVDSAGYAPQSFGLKIEGRADSGTALKLRERKSFITKGKKERYWKARIERVLETMLIIDREVLGNRKITPGRPTATFADTLAADLRETSQSINLLHAAEAASLKTRITMAHPDWSKEQVEEELAAIQEEQSASAPVDLTAFGRSVGGAGEDETEEVEGDESEEPLE